LSQLRSSVHELVSAKRELVQTVRACVDAQSVAGWLDTRIKRIPTVQAQIKGLVLAVAKEADKGGLFAGDASVGSLRNLLQTKGNALCELEQVSKQRLPLSPSDQGKFRSVTAVGTVLTAIAALIVDWLKSDARLKSVSQVYDESNKAVSFLDAWSKVYQQIETLPQGKTKELAKDLAETALSQALSRAKILPRGETASTLAGHLWERLRNLLSLLQLDVPKHSAIWIPQLFYYAVFIMLVLVVVRSAQSLLDTAVIALAALTFALWLLCFGLNKSVSKKWWARRLSSEESPARV